MRADGFTLIETLVALALTMVVTGTALSLLAPASRASVTQPEVMDVQQRARVAAEMLARDIAPAGAGRFVAIGSAPRGVLAQTLPAILPRRLGGLRGDGPDVARATAITVLSVPMTSAQTTTATRIDAATLSLNVTSAPHCGTAVLCGLVAGDDVLVTDGDEHFDVFRITRVTGTTGTLRHHGQDLAWSYPPGSVVSAVVQRTFAVDTAARQLRQYDGDQSDQPAVDHVTALTFRYFGAAVGGGLVELPLSSLTDGPWIGVGSSRFDRDLLAVRMVRAVVTAEAADATLRATVPALTVSVDIAPRALGVAR